MTELKGATARNPSTVEQIKELVAKTGPNPALLEFPTDTWGFTSGVRKEVLKAASSVRGQADKHLLLIGTLQVLIAHIKARYEPDIAARENEVAFRDAQAADRINRNRVVATPAPVSATKENPDG